LKSECKTKTEKDSGQAGMTTQGKRAGCLPGASEIRKATVQGSKSNQTFCEIQKKEVKEKKETW